MCLQNVSKLIILFYCSIIQQIERANHKINTITGAQQFLPSICKHYAKQKHNKIKTKKPKKFNHFEMSVTSTA